jgi:predicted Rossmann fold flavoprotein
MPLSYDIAVIGAGAAGLMAGITAARAAPAGPSRKIVILDGAKTLGAKILVAGGGRCNVTHHSVDESAFAGSSRNAIKNVLRSFPVKRTVAFFSELGVELKQEPTGKLFPTTDSARTVLDALLNAARDAGAEIIHPWRVDTITRAPDGTFLITRAPGPAPSPSDHQSPVPGPRCLSSPRLILATGGLSLPKTGSDGHGHTLARSLGHSITPRVHPALVPLTIAKSHWICALSGLTVPATLELRSATGKRLVSFTNSTLCTHFGLSGPSVLDISRYYTGAHAQDPGAHLVINWLAGTPPETLDAALLGARGPSIARWLAESAPHAQSVVDHVNVGMPDRLARALCDSAHPPVEPSTPVHALTKIQRRAIVAAATATPLPVTGDRGYLFAEVTAGGVPLSELHLATMESRITPGLFLCGELCDVDGRIGGFNFQWAWASGHAAGQGAAASATDR